MELSPTSRKLCMELVNVLGKANAGSWASFSRSDHHQPTLLLVRSLGWMLLKLLLERARLHLLYPTAAYMLDFHGP
jgi:hypothetical protein